MLLLINVVTAWVTVILMVLLLLIYGLRRLIQKGNVPKVSWVRMLNKKLRKPHKFLGIMALFTGFVHGYFSSVAILSTNKGTILWLLFGLLGLIYMMRKSIKIGLPWIKVHRLVAVATVVFLCLHLIEVNWFVGIEPIIMAIKADMAVEEILSNPVPSMTEDSNVTSISSRLMTLDDGVYLGEAMGYRPGILVEVTLKNHVIEMVKIRQHNEVREAFWGLPVREIPLAIVAAQSVEVDIVSGATFTSYGIMNAVDDALSEMNLVEEVKDVEAVKDVEEVAEVEDVEDVEAVKDVEEVEDVDDVEAVKDVEEVAAVKDVEDVAVVEDVEDVAVLEDVEEVEVVENVEDQGSIYVDGVYIGIADGFRPGLKVEVVVEDGLMTRVEVIDHHEKNERYWGRPMVEIPVAIIQNQSTEVDVISGATFTSKGIMTAVEEALGKALK